MIGVVAPPSKAKNNSLDRFIDIQGFELEGQVLTMAKDWIWTQNAISYTNTETEEFAIAFSAPGKERIEIIGATPNGFQRLVGEELATAIAPVIPPNFLTATFYTVSNMAISTPSLAVPYHTHSMAQVLGLGAALNALEDKIAMDIEMHNNDQNAHREVLDAEVITFGQYHSGRNDGQLPHNKVLSTDADGNLKLYTIATQSAPYLRELIPDSYLPASTGDIYIHGDFFTRSMTLPGKVLIEEQTINYVNFISSQLLKANCTIGANEGVFGITLDNGLVTTVPNALLIVLGDVVKPQPDEWVNISPTMDVSTAGEAKIGQFGVMQSAIWETEFEITNDWRLMFNYKASPFGAPDLTDGLESFIELLNASDNSVFCELMLRTQLSQNRYYFQITAPSNGYVAAFANATDFVNDQNVVSFTLEFSDNALKLFNNGAISRVLPDELAENLKLRIRSTNIDIINIKKIQLA